MSGVQDVTASPGQNAIIMVFGLDDPAQARERVLDLCGRLPALVRSELNRFPDSLAGMVVAFGARAWAGLLPGWPVPGELSVFEPIQGERHLAPSTPGDLFFHVRSARMDVCQELAAHVSRALSGVAESLDETHGFRYFDSRAIIGFVDGTENPSAEEAQGFATIAPDPAVTGKADFSGGSYVFIQKYLHDLKAWEELPVEEQEKAIGRRKFDDLELDGPAKPANAHNAVTNIRDQDGGELKIVRANIAFANPSRGEYGTYFLGYAGKFSTTRRMLQNMFLGDPPGNTDRLLDFSRAVSGTLFFAPSAGYLELLASEA
ncbi:MAG: Dyp-type peroxidase [Deltaproteobacteria bacterium]|jgi:putative iron-dependent peroxidase|nr:Dyp-type peroxidase [Deltaproteobacteria bacterium]